ncbi:hypothetical protein SLA2020_088140 [Shorea laevis]
MKGRLVSVLTAVEDDVVKELVPLEGEEEGVGSIYLRQHLFPVRQSYASETTTRKRRVIRSEHLCLQEPNMWNANGQEMPIN